MSFGLRLKQARNEAGLTQQELADRLGIAKSTIAGYENNSREPDVLKIKKITEILNVDADYLLGVEKIPHFSSKEKSMIEQYRFLDFYGKKAVDSILNIEIERIEEEQKEKAAKETPETKDDKIVEVPKTPEEMREIWEFKEIARDKNGTKEKYKTNFTPENIDKMKIALEMAKRGEFNNDDHKL